MSGQEIITADGEVISGFMAPEQASLAIQLSRAEVDQKIATARAYPRQVTKAIQNIMTLATLDEETAEECSYALPRGKKPIVGPSARFAEIVYQNWGNCIVGARVVHVDRVEKYVEAEGVYHDLETNASKTARVRRRIVDSQGRLYSDDMIIVTGNAACSIASRNAILSGVPKAVWRKAYDAAEKVVKGDIKTLSERREAIFKAFAAFGVKPEQIFAALDIAGEDDITLEHIPTLTGMRSALKSGEATVEEMFGGQSKSGSEKKSTSQKMSEFAKGGDGGDAKKKETAKPENGKAETAAKPSTENKETTKKESGTGGKPGKQEVAESYPPTSDDIEIARDKGHDAFHNGMPRETCPREYNEKGREPERDAWFEGFDAAAEDEAGARN